ncbi:hypothetical protein FNF31_07666 [Cafeteria roenbergensis]|uniref:Uncharacterized protein n=1 Tax=Cafeteria roenbergensis TaxID=33653 RepID=A0A5A8C1S0_CAFRO|nr:hypothetical protein FNF31_07666 [Cafeteria roenbergensis]
MAEDAPAAAPVATEEVAPAAAATTTEVGKEEVITHLDALKVVLRKSRRHQRPAPRPPRDRQGARQRHGPPLLLAADCDNPEYVKLIKASAAPRWRSSRSSPRGARPVVRPDQVQRGGRGAQGGQDLRCAITDFGEDSKELAILLAHVKKASA